jgi:phospholipid/cholesterol/gamma-HCH transport system substrate-binding protein
VVVGKVGSIEERLDGKAVLNLEMQSSQMHLIPSNVRVDIASPTVFGAKSVELVPLADSSPQPLKAGSVLQNKGSRRDRHR